MVRERPVSIAELRYRYLEPNFTAIVPGVCQVSCRFCMELEGPPPPSLAFSVVQLERLVLRELPAIFRIVSISGGGPTLSRSSRRRWTFWRERAPLAGCIAWC